MRNRIFVTQILATVALFSCATGDSFPIDPKNDGGRGGQVESTGTVSSSSSSSAGMGGNAGTNSASSSSSGMAGAAGQGGSGTGGSVSSSSSSASSSSSSGDPCMGMVCDMPPAAGCQNATTVVTYSPMGTCTNGSCSYTPTMTTCGFGQECKNGACMATTCSTPVDACGTGNQNRSGCANARVIGRLESSVSSGFFVSANTCSATNQSEGPNATSCWDYGRDHSYRIFMRTGESIDITMTLGAKCANATSWDAVVKIYAGTGCQDKSCATKSSCQSFSSGTFMKNFVAPADGWYVVVVDGRASAFDDSGTYSLTVKLHCLTAGCGC